MRAKVGIVDQQRGCVTVLEPKGELGPAEDGPASGSAMIRTVVRRKRDDSRLPPEGAGVDRATCLAQRLVVLFEHGICEMYDVLAFVILDHLERLAPADATQPRLIGATAIHSRVHDVPMGDGGLLGDFIQTDLVLAVKEELDDLLLPVCSVTEQTEIGEGLFR
jgi:hypothetical protein